MKKLFLQTIVVKKSNLLIAFLILAGFVVLVRLATEVKMPFAAVTPSEVPTGSSGGIFWEGVNDETIKEFGLKQGTWDEPGSQEETSKNTAAKEKNKNERGDFFMEYRLERDRIRGQQIDLLREIINNQNTSNESRREAQNRLLAISQSLEKEMAMENLIRAKGFSDAVVFIENTSVTVIVKSKTLKDSDIEKINGLILRHSTVKKEDIVIIPKT